jgi:membrane-bound ClpP family serine protease
MRRAVFAAIVLTALTTPLAAQESSTVLRFPIRGTVPEDFDIRIQRIVTDAQARAADALFLDIDVWQGRLDVVQTGISWILDADFPVYAFVSGVAHETGALIALAADTIVMTPGSSIGGQIQGLFALDPDLTNDLHALRTEFHRLIERRGLDGHLGDAMADRAVSVPGIVDTSTVLTLTAQEAMDLGVASWIAPNLDAAKELLGLDLATLVSANERGFTGATIEIQNNSWRDVRVYVVRGSTRKRLGLITSMGFREYILEPAEIASGAAVRLVADPVGSAEDHLSQSIRMESGITIQWNLQNNPRQSSIFVFRP